MANKTLWGTAKAAMLWGTAAAIVCGYGIGRGIAEMKETREIAPKRAHVVTIEGFLPRETNYNWREGEDASVSYEECDASEYGRLAVIPMRRCRGVSIGTQGICSDAITGVCVDNKCRARDEMTPEQIYATFRKYEELCDILDCDSICEEWKKKAGFQQ